MGTEFELKYRASREQLEALAAAHPGLTAIAMTTEYFDTPKNTLSARKWTLRHRQEGARHVCTLKTPGSDGVSRGEWEVESADIFAAVEPLARLSGLPELTELTKDGLSVTCGARFTRLVGPVRAGDSTGELALDSGELVNGAKKLPFAEAEVELKAGDPADIVAFAQALAAEYGLEPEKRSKFHRARLLGQEDHHGI